MIRTNPPPHYLPPTAQEMREKATDLKIRGYSPDFASDLANLFAGGDVLETLPLEGRVCATQGKCRPQDYERILAQRQDYHGKVAQFLRDMQGQESFATLANDDSKSPLTKSMMLLSLMAQQNASEGEGGDFGLPIYSAAEAAETQKKAARALDAMIQLEELEQEERDAIDPKGEKTPMEMARDLVAGKKEMLEIARLLDAMPAMRPRRTQPIPDPQGMDRRWRQMRGIGDLPRIQNSAWVDYQTHRGLFLARVAQNGYLAKERIEYEDRKQHIFLLLDVSGSMGHGTPAKFYFAAGVVLNRCQAVLKREAIVHLATFAGSMEEVETIDTPEKARAFIAKAQEKGLYSGGSTSIPGAIKSAEEWIEKNLKDVGSPEIVVVTDDDAGGACATPANKLHAFICAQNDGLERIARETKGVCVRLDKGEGK